MSTENQARALMMRHHHNIKNRQQSMLGRSASEIGLDVEAGEYWNTIQGKTDTRKSYDRSSAALS